MAPRDTSGRDPSDRQSDKSGGFSLIEVLIVLAVIAMMAVVVGPTIGSSLGSVTRRTIERGVEVQLLEARLSAIETRRAQVFFDPSQPPSTQASADRAAVVLTLPQGWTYRIQNAVEFFPDGGCGAGTVLLDKPGEPTLSVTLDPSSCRARAGR